MNRQDITLQWRNAGMAVALAVAVVLFSFFDTVRTLVMTWWDKPEYNHCLLILPVIAYLVHERREIFHKIAPKPSLWGLVPILAGGILWLMGDLADTNVIRQFGLVILLQGCLLTILGKRVVLALLFPFFYMIFLIPFGNFLIPALQDFTASFMVAVLHLLNIPVYVQGLYLSVPAGDFQVAESCAGLRFLVATVALGTLMANVAYKTFGRQLIVVILSFVVPVIANGFRATGIILIANWSDMKYATGFDHIVFGWIFFALVLLIFISIAMTFTNRGIHDGYIDFSKKYWTENEKVTAGYFIPFIVIVVIFTAFAPIYASVIEQRYQTFDHYTLVPDGKMPGRDVSQDASWKPHYAGASQTFHLRADLSASESVDIFMAYYKYQTGDIEMISYGNGVAQKDVWGRIENRKIGRDITGLGHMVNEVLLQSGQQKRLVWYWYWADGELTASKYKAKLLDAKAKLLNGRLDSAVMAISILVDEENINRQRQKLAQFAASLPPFSAMVTETR